MFHDRADAGYQLAAEVIKLDLTEPIVLGLARGGLEVASRVAMALRAPLDVLVVRKLGHPAQPELAIGALAEGDVLVTDDVSARRLGVNRETIKSIAERERAELMRRIDRYRFGMPLKDLWGQTVVVVDDGIATGLTMRAAISSVEQAKAERIIVATPVASPDVLSAFSLLVYDVVCVESLSGFGSVGAVYENFTQLDDLDVIRILRT